jgi:hypothetical protein
VPDDFQVVHRYPQIEDWCGFFEPDVERLPDGTYTAVVQRYFHELYAATSTDGVNFSFSSEPILSVSEPGYDREMVSNPGLIYDQTTGLNYGAAFGMASPSIDDHDIGFAYSQYVINIRSPHPSQPGNYVWHVCAESEWMNIQDVSVFEYTDFDLVRVIDPVTGAILLEQDFSGAAVGDLWDLVATALLLGDVNLDRAVNGLDVDPFVSHVVWGPDQAEADMDQDGHLGGLDVQLFIDAVIGGSVTAVPEPSTLPLATIAVLGLLYCRHEGR